MLQDVATPPPKGRFSHDALPKIPSAGKYKNKKQAFTYNWMESEEKTGRKMKDMERECKSRRERDREGETDGGTDRKG